MESPPTPAASPAPALSFHLEVDARTDVGLEREDNQDSFLVVTPDAAGPGPAWALLAVCDGMGGAAGGDVASRTAVGVLREVLSEGGAPATPDVLGRRLVHGVEEASRRVHAASRADPTLAGMGTTATACALTGDTLFVAQVGDSRAYLLRDGVLTQITRDQTLGNLMRERGELTDEGLAAFPLGHVILQALGATERVDVELSRLRLAQGDVLLLCSDGLHGPVTFDALVASLLREPTPAAACASLIAQALASGGPDNVTCVVARVTGEALAAAAGPPVAERVRPSERAPAIVPVAAEEVAPAVVIREKDPRAAAKADSVLAHFAEMFKQRKPRR